MKLHLAIEVGLTGALGLLVTGAWLALDPTGTDRQVLLASAEQSGWACVHCEAEISTVSLVAEEEISTLGYGILEEPKAGCATGCGAGGCGVGSAQTRPS